MLRPTLIAVILMGGFALSSGAWAQTVYRCGGSYSQTPCPGAVVIDASDPRSSAQKLQADSITRRDASAADALRQARLEQEKSDIEADESELERESDGESSTARASKRDKKKKKRAKRNSDRTQGPDLKKGDVKKNERRP